MSILSQPGFRNEAAAFAFVEAVPKIPTPATRPNKAS